ncbi:MAG: bile acid:sodium symporter [Acidobacteria bacterium]|nr:bile acid:sodium symporter [Acidobacteriota bacterium]
MDGAVLDVIVGVSVLVFVLASMLSMGFSLTVPQIITPLRDVRLVLIALAVNFIAVPLLAYLIDLVLSLDESLFIGLILIATAAGAPFLPKLAEVAKGDVAFSVGLMVLLMVVTVVYMPIALPLLLEGVEINAWEIASSLIFLMILPLAIGLFFKWRYEGVADTLSPLLGQVSSVAIALLVVAGVIANWSAIVGLIGTRGIVAAVVLIIGGLVIGYVSGGSQSGTRSVMGLGTGQRNLSAALVVAAQNFSDDPDVLAFIIAAAIIGLVLLMLAGGELGRRVEESN